MTKPAQPAKSPPQNGITLGDGVRFAAQSPSVFLRFLCSFFVVLCGAVGSLLTFTSFFSVPVSPFAVALTAVLFSLLFLLLFLWKRGLKFTLPAFALLYGLCVYLQFDRLRDGFCLLYNRTVLSLQARSNWTFLTFSVQPRDPESFLITLFLIFFTILLTFLLCVAVYAAGSFWAYLLLTIPLPWVGLIFEFIPSYLPFILLLAGYMGCIAMRISLLKPHGKPAKGVQFERERSKRRPVRVYCGKQRGRTAASSLFLLCCTLLLFFLGMLVFPRGSFQRSDRVNDLYYGLRYAIQNFSVADLIRPPGASGGVSGGDLASAGNLTMRGETHLRFRSDSKEPMYLRGYAGSVYTGTSWDPLPDSAYNAYLDTFDQFSREGFSPLNMNANYLSTLLLSSAWTDHFPQLNTVSVENVAANPQFLYLPYNLADGEASGALTGASYHRDAYVETSPVFPLREYTVSAYLHDRDFANDVVLSYEYSGLDTSFFGRHAHSQINYRYIQAPSFKSNEQLYRSFVYSVYTDVPQALRERLQALADEQGWAAYQEDPDALVDAIRDYFSRTVSYTLTPGSTPTDRDFVEYFLFENKRGYCMHYASSMALLLRTMGYPTRFAEGYMVSNADYVSPDENGFYAIKDSNAHAWVEIYRDGFGWTPYESIPSFVPGMAPSGEQAVSEPDPSEPPESSSAPESQAPSAPESSRPESGLSSNAGSRPESRPAEDVQDGSSQALLYPLLLFLGLVLLFAAGLVLRRFAARALRKRLFRAQKLGRSFAAIERYLYRLFAFGGSRNRENLAPLEYAGLLERRYASVAPGLCTEMMELLAKYRYSAHPPAREDRDRLARLAGEFSRAVYASLSTGGRLRFRYLEALG